MASTLIRNVVMVCSVAALCAALVGCSSSDDGKAAELEKQLDMAEAARMTAEDQLADLRTQVEMLMGRADISPADIADLRAQVEMLMGRADISPADIADLRAQVEMLMGRADTAEQALADAQFDAAVANAIEKVTAYGLRQEFYDEDNEVRVTSGRLHQQDAFPDTGTEYSSVSQIHEDRVGRREAVNLAAVWRGDDGQVEFLVDIQAPGIRRDGVTTWPNSSIYTAVGSEDIEGATISSGAIQDHGLGSGWKGFEATKAYDAGGELTARLFTDLEDSENVAPPYDWELDIPEVDIFLNDARVPVPDSLPGRDGQYVTMPQDGLKGSLDGIEGMFTCTGGYCSLLYNRVDWVAGYAPWIDSAPVLFTPDGGGQPSTIPPTVLTTPSPEVPKVNYLSFGNWLYVPEDVTDLDAFRFGLYAGGDDPFTAANLMGLAGTATYAGKATGMYVATVPSGVDTFSADVELNAEFGSESEFGTISGSITNFGLGSGTASPLNTLLLSAYESDDGNSIFARPPWWSDEQGLMPGGFIEGDTLSEADGKWWGTWGGKFFGNGSTPTDHPASFAGTFGATDGERSFAGSFGAHEQ